MAGKPGLVGRHARDRAAAEEEATTDEVGVGRLHDAAAGGCNGLEVRFGRQQHQRAVRGHQAALIGAVGVQVDDERRRRAGAGARRGDRSHHLRQPAAVVVMPVGEEHALDAREVDGEPCGVGQPHVRIGADVEQHRVSLGAAAACREHGVTVAGAAQLVEYDLAFMALVHAVGCAAREQVHDFRDLGHPVVDAGQRVGLVVDDDEQVQCIKRGQRGGGNWHQASSGWMNTRGCGLAV